MSSYPQLLFFPETCHVPLLLFAYTVWNTISSLTLTSCLFKLLFFQYSVQMSLWEFSSLYSFLSQITTRQVMEPEEQNQVVSRATWGGLDSREIWFLPLPAIAGFRCFLPHAWVTRTSASFSYLHVVFASMSYKSLHLEPISIFHVLSSQHP